MNRSKEVALYHYANGEKLEKTAKHFKLKRSSVRRELRRFKEKKSPAKILMLDIETSPIHFRAWRPGRQYVSYKQITKQRYVICWAAKWLYSNQILGECVTPKESLKRDDKRIVKPAWDLMNEADIVIGHNVRAFDIKQLNARFIGENVAGGVPPMNYCTIDTLAISRRNFNLPSHSQDFLTKYLHLPEKFDTDITLWVGCEEGNEEDLKYMFKYCKQDVFGNEELYLKLRPWIRSHPNVAIYGDLQDQRCPACGSDNIEVLGEYVTPMNTYDSYRCECGALSRDRKTALTKFEKEKLLRSTAK